MSSYPPQQDNPGQGFNLDAMSPWQKAAIVSDPRAMQVATYLQQLNHQKEQRDQQRQIFQMEMEDRQRKRAHEDFTTALSLHDAGFLPVHPGTVGKFEAGLGGRDTVTAPSGTQYSQPTQQQRFQQAAVRASEEGSLAGIKAKATTDITEPNVSMAFPDGQGGNVTLQIPRSQTVNALRVQQDMKAKRYSAHSFQTDKDGTTTFVGIPENGGEPVKIPLGEVGKPQAARSSQQKTGLSSGAAKAFKEAQDAIDLARKGPSPQKFNGIEIDDPAHDQKAQTLWQTARNAVARATSSFPDELDGGPGGDGFAHIEAKVKGNGPGVTVASVKGAPAGKVPVLKAANIAEAARRKGMTPDQFRAWFTDPVRGGVIQ